MTATVEKTHSKTTETPKNKIKLNWLEELSANVTSFASRFTFKPPSKKNTAEYTATINKNKGQINLKSRYSNSSNKETVSQYYQMLHSASKEGYVFYSNDSGIPRNQERFQIYFDGQFITIQYLDKNNKQIIGNRYVIDKDHLKQYNYNFNPIGESIRNEQTKVKPLAQPKQLYNMDSDTSIDSEIYRKALEFVDHTLSTNQLSSLAPELQKKFFGAAKFVKKEFKNKDSGVMAKIIDYSLGYKTITLLIKNGLVSKEIEVTIESFLKEYSDESKEIKDPKKNQNPVNPTVTFAFQ